MALKISLRFCKTVNLVVKQELLDNQIGDTQREWEKSYNILHANTTDLW